MSASQRVEFTILFWTWELIHTYNRRFLWDQESHLWDMFQDLDKNGDGRLDAREMRAALSRAGIDITPATVTDLVRFLASGANHGKEGGVDDMYITFQEFRDFLIMLPRQATPFEIYKCESLVVSWYWSVEVETGDEECMPEHGCPMDGMTQSAQS